MASAKQLAAARRALASGSLTGGTGQAAGCGRWVGTPPPLLPFAFLPAGPGRYGSSRAERMRSGKHRLLFRAGIWHGKTNQGNKPRELIINFGFARESSSRSQLSSCAGRRLRSSRSDTVPAPQAARFLFLRSHGDLPSGLLHNARVRCALEGRLFQAAI